MKLKITVFKLRMPHNQCVAILLHKIFIIRYKIFKNDIRRT